MNELVDTVIIGGGQAGLAMSYHLSQACREHIILERARVAENWRSARWDSLVFQFPSWCIKLPGYKFDDGNPDGCAPKDAVAAFIEMYAVKTNAPMRCGVDAKMLRHDSRSGRFSIETSAGQIRALNVVVATGSYHRPIIPDFSANLPAHVMQVHSRDYKNPEQLPPGAVLIVGSGASGVQIAEELYESGRTVHLSVGRHDKAPRRYRGKDLYWWFDVLGIWERPLDLQPELRSNRILISGAGGGHDIDLRQFAANGIALHGKLNAVEDSRLFFASDMEDNLRRGESWFSPYKARMDAHAEIHGLELPSDDKWNRSSNTSALDRQKDAALELSTNAIASIVWAGGFKYDFNWIALPVFDDRGAPIMNRGVTACRGLYFLGLRRTHTIRSGLLPGVGDDAAYLAQHIALRP